MYKFVMFIPIKDSEIFYRYNSTFIKIITSIKYYHCFRIAIIFRISVKIQRTNKTKNCCFNKKILPTEKD